MNNLFIKIAVATATLAFTGSIVSCSSTQLSKNSKNDSAPGFYNVSLNRFLPAAPAPDLVSKASSLPRDRKGYPTYDETKRHRFVRTTAYSCAECEPGVVEGLHGLQSDDRTFRGRATQGDVHVSGCVTLIACLCYT